MRDAGAEAGGDAGLFEAAAREPGPEDAAVLVDQIEAVAPRPAAAVRPAAGPAAPGLTPTEIAPRLGVSRQTVHRALNLLQQRLAAADRER